MEWESELETEDDKTRGLLENRLDGNNDNAQRTDTTKPPVTVSTRRIISSYTLKLDTVGANLDIQRAAVTPRPRQGRTTCRPLRYQNQWFCDMPGNVKGRVLNMANPKFFITDSIK